MFSRASRKRGLTAHDFALRLLEEKQVAVVPGTAFSAAAEGYVRCAYAASMSDIETAMSRIREFVTEIKQ